jgi:hypothetical protein
MVFVSLFVATQVMRISIQPSPVQIMTDQKQDENVEYFNYVGSITTNDAKHTHEINSGLPWQTQH